ncbi:hypothetical protein GTPT_1481 [Tatumella ptyseos ATCC 33301]|uniref:Uncharacterized protein n=2 Tax=Tatumella ptyseos TaxID=82987 RepID=A0A085JHT6_9GAMM|nr:hypothetical protein GTPT_1481 [Tatumella ptyseos ATCC 33301]SQK75893.1 Probable two-component-system connector protein AriR [Tatumella ptyseos]
MTGPESGSDLHRINLQLNPFFSLWSINRMDNNVQQTTHEAEITRHFRNAGDKLTAETEVLDAVIADIVMHGRKVTNKAIILYLIAELENSSDPVHLDILRGALEIIVAKTPDDKNI